MPIPFASYKIKGYRLNFNEKGIHVILFVCKTAYRCSDLLLCDNY